MSRSYPPHSYDYLQNRWSTSSPSHTNQLIPTRFDHPHTSSLPTAGMVHPLSPSYSRLSDIQRSHMLAQHAQCNDSAPEIDSGRSTYPDGAQTYFMPPLPPPSSQFPTDGKPADTNRRESWCSPEVASYLIQNRPEQPTQEIIYTDNASAKLTPWIRRQCFNCHALQTCTWRKSILRPGKIICNKCGLFERTHSRARPEFPRIRRQQTDHLLTPPKSDDKSS